MTARELRWSRDSAQALCFDASLRREWDHLNDARLGLAFLRADVMVAALKHFGSVSVQLLTGRCDEKAVAMLLLVPSGRLQWTTFQPSQVPLGAWVAEPDIALHDLTRQLVRNGALGICLSLSITQIDPLQAARIDDRDDIRCDDYIPSSWLTVGGGFDAYWAQRGKNLRQNLRKQRNKLAADGVRAAMKVLREPEDMAPALARYGAMESGGWKAQQGTAIHPDNAQGRFYLQVLQDAALRGEALVTEYVFDERTVAMNLALLRQGTLVVLKTTYDESIPKALSPASLLREDELRSFFQGQQVQRIEYYGRTMEWHTKLTDQQRTLYHMTTYRWPWLKRLAARRRRDEAAQGSEPATLSASSDD